jgi:undecaprenyl-diphosphatase
MDELFRAALLGFIQGLTEFLPVSSSGHLAVGARLFGEAETSLAFIVLLHVGTLIATALVLREEVLMLLGEIGRSLRAPARLRETPEGRQLAAVALGTLVTAACALALQPVADGLTRALAGVGACMLITAGLLLTTRTERGGAATASPRVALIVGLAQGIAVLPGISRSGSTIAVAMLLGMHPSAAFRFSFMLSIPIIILAVGHEIVLGDAAREGLTLSAAVGGFTAFAVGLVALVWLRKLVQAGRFWAFSVYLVPVGLAVIAYGLGVGGQR